MNKFLFIFLLICTTAFSAQDTTYNVVSPIRYLDGIKTQQSAEIAVTVSILDQGSSAPTPASNQVFYELLDNQGTGTGAYVVITAITKKPPPPSAVSVLNQSDVVTGQKLKIRVTSDTTGVEVLDLNGNPTGTFVKVDIISPEDD